MGSAVDTPQFGKAFTPKVDRPFLTLGQLAEHVEFVTGLRLSDIKADGIRVTSEPGRPEAPVWLEITTYCRNEHGGRYFDENREVATEVRRFPLAALLIDRSL